MFQLLTKGSGLRDGHLLTGSTADPNRLAVAEQIGEGLIQDRKFTGRQSSWSSLVPT